MGIHHSPHTHTIPIPMGIPMGIPIPTAALLIVSVAVYYLPFATYFGVKRLKIAISEDIVMRKQPFIRSRSSNVIDFGTNRKRVYCVHIPISDE